MKTQFLIICLILALNMFTATAESEKKYKILLLITKIILKRESFNDEETEMIQNEFNELDINRVFSILLNHNIFMLF